MTWRKGIGEGERGIGLWERIGEVILNGSESRQSDLIKGYCSRGFGEQWAPTASMSIALNSMLINSHASLHYLIARHICKQSEPRKEHQLCEFCIANAITLRASLERSLGADQHPHHLVLAFDGSFLLPTVKNGSQ